MDTEAHSPSERESLRDEAVASYLLAVDEGRAPDPEDWLRRYPAVADKLRDFFVAQGAMQRLAAPTPPATSATNSTKGVGEDTAPFAFSPPARLGDYEILEELGHGGMGVVYKARQVSLGRLVGLKMILAGPHVGQTHRVRFQTEAEVIGRLQHPNIVQIFEVGEHEGMPYLSLEFCSGGSLEKKLRGNPLLPAEAAALVETLALAMQAAHDKRVIHRDLKPANVLYGEDGTPKVTDFGLAKKTEEQGQTQEGAIVGTPSYMAPEQAAPTGEVGPGCDVYALGAILYECLTGRPPFKAATTLDTLMQVVSDDPVSPRQLNAQVPRDLETICLKCLHKLPGRRYDSALSLADDLGRFQRGEPIWARPVGMVERTVKLVKRNVAVSSLVGAVFVALMSGLIVSLWQRDLAQKEASRADGKAREAEDNLKLVQEEQKQTRMQRDRAECLAYAGRLALAQAAFQEGNSALAWHYLDQCQLNMRGWEHHYLSTRYNSKQTFRGHTGGVCSVAVSPDGKCVASGGGDETIKVWDAATGKETLSLKHAGPPLAFSPDGKRIASGGVDKTVKVWDTDNGIELLALKGHKGDVISVAWSRDGKRILSGGGDLHLFKEKPDIPGEVKVWDADKGTEVLSLLGHTHTVWSVAFSPDGKRIVTGSVDKTAKVWDADKGQELLTLKGHTDIVLSVAFSPDGKRIATASTGDTVTVWDAGEGQEMFSLKGHRGSVYSVAYSPDGRRIVSGSADHTVKVWDADKGTELHSYVGHADVVHSVAFSPDGRRIVTGSEDSTVKSWDATRGQEVLALKGHTNPVLDMAFSPDGKRIASGSRDNTIKVWDANTGQELLALKGHTERVVSVAFSPDGKRIASAGGFASDSERMPFELKVWDADKGTELLSLEGNNNVTCMAYSPDGKYIAIGSSDQIVKVWDADKGTALFSLTTGRSGSLAYSPDGKRIVTGCEDKTVKVWDAATGKEILLLTGHSEAVFSVAFSPDGKRIISGSTDKTVKVWDAAKGTELLTLKGHTSRVQYFSGIGGTISVISVAFSPDGKHIVIATIDKTVTLWDADTGQELLALMGHTDHVNRVAFSPDGKRIAGASQDNTIRVWVADKRREVLSLKEHTSEVVGVAFHHDGKRVFGWDLTGKVLAWTVADGQPTAPTDPPDNAKTKSSVSVDGSRRAWADSNNVILLDVALYERQNLWPLPECDERLRHHREQARLAEDQKQWFAVAFHLGRLLLDQPDDADLKRRRDEAIQKHFTP